jgi:hypothetical protein
MQRVQELMRVVEVKEPDDTISTMDRVSRLKSSLLLTAQFHFVSSVSLLVQNSENRKLLVLKQWPKPKVLYQMRSMRQEILCGCTNMWSKLIVGYLVDMDEREMRLCFMEV